MRTFQMRIYLQFLILSICFSAHCFAQGPQPTFTYTLHAQKEPRVWTLIEVPAPPSTVLTVTPLGALLVLIPQPERKWVLKQLTGWSTPTPKEQTLAIAGGAVGDEDVWITGELTVTSDSNALIRIEASRRSSDPDTRDVEASIISIDLHTFKILYRRDTTDPLIAGAQWHLAKDGLLISISRPKRSRVKTKKVFTVNDSYEAAALSLPDLRASASCQYTEMLELVEGNNQWTKERGKVAPVDCANVLGAAGVESIDELPGRDAFPRVVDAPTFPPNCGATNVSSDGHLVLYQYSCGHPTNWDTYETISRSVVVLSPANGATVFSMPLKINQPIASRLATTDNQHYLVLLRQGIHLEGYRLP
jgi:hypothetical protein